jgi:DNA invertase Pin-like site-specific DNA recombinase
MVGDALASTGDQDTEAQAAALRAAGRVREFTDLASGAKAAVSQFDASVHYLNADTLVVWRLDRLGQSLPHPRWQRRVHRLSPRVSR